MSLIDFTHTSCKTKEKINKQIVENLDEHFAMYSFTAIKNMPNLELTKDNQAYIFKGSEKECKEIMNTLSSYQCSHFNTTLVPVFTMIDEGLKIEFKIAESV